MLRLSPIYHMHHELLQYYKLNKDGNVIRDGEKDGTSTSPSRTRGAISLGDKRNKEQPLGALQVQGEVQPKIAVVGHEKGGIVLLSRSSTDDTDGVKTFIELYDLNRKRLITIYKHMEEVKVVGCSVNEERTLIAFTIRRVEVVNYKYEEIFESFVGELHPKGGCYPVVVRTTQEQKVKFLYSDSTSTGKKTMAYLLYFLNEEYINLYVIAFKSRPDGGVKMSSLPTLKAVLTKNFLWCEWDTRRGFLYTLTGKPGNKAFGDYFLRCFHFPDKKPSLFEKEEKEISLLFEIPLQMQLSSNKFEPMYTYSYNIHEHVSPGSQYMHVVQMRGNALCLCHQHKLDLDAPGPHQIEISVYMLHCRTKVDFTIPMMNVEEDTVRNTRVFFESIGDLLLVFVPGYYLQLLDCGQDHGPCPSLTFTGPKRVPSLAHRIDMKEPAIVPFDIMNRNSAEIRPDLRGHALLECTQGIVYELTFDIDVMADLFQNLDTPEMDLQALHLAIMHIQDSAIVEKIITNMLQHSPEHVTPALFSEYIIGASYVEIKKKLRPLTDLPIEQLLPITCIETLSELAQRKALSPHASKVTVMNGYNYIPGTKTPIKEKDEEKRFLFNSPSSPSVNNSPAIAVLKESAASPSPGVTRFIMGILGFDNNQPSKTSRAASMPERVLSKEEECMKLYTEALLSHFLEHYPKEKTICQFAAKEYPKILIAQVEKLYKYIIFRGGTTNLAYLHLLENFYCSLEELQLPPPPQFNLEFLVLAYKCLPRCTFLQYIHRGIMRPEPEFVKNVALSLASSDRLDDRDFIYQLCCQLPDQSKAVEIMQIHEQNHPHLFQHLVSRLPHSNSTKKARTSTYDSMEGTDDSPFIPLSVFLHSIRGDQTGDLAWLREGSEKLAGKTFQLAFPTGGVGILGVSTSSSTTSFSVSDESSEETLFKGSETPQTYEESLLVQTKEEEEEEELRAEQALLEEEDKEEVKEE